VLLTASSILTASPQDQTAAPLVEIEPIVIEELGVSIQPPRHAAMSRETGPEGEMSVTLSDSSPIPIWQMRIQALVPTLANPTPELLIQDHLAKLKEAGQELTVLSSKEIMLGDVRGWQAYLSDSKAEEPLVNGYLIVPGKGPPFIVFSFVCTLSDFAKMRPAIEQSLNSVRLESPVQIAQERADKLKAGAALIERFNADTMRKLIGLDQWFRHYRPATEGAQEVEIGVSRVTVREGKRGELNVDRKESQYDASERKIGMLLTVQARVILNSERDQYYDTLAMYWMSWDNSEEAWSIVASQKQGDRALTEAESGWRSPITTGEPRGSLHVVKSGVEGSKRDPKSWPLPDFYLSQPVGWLLGHLMATNNVPAGEYSFYAYDSTLGNVSARLDTWEPAREGKGVHTLTTRLTPKTLPYTSTYDGSGNLVQRTRQDGSITVPTSIDQIKRIWETKGLKLRSNP